MGAIVTSIVRFPEVNVKPERVWRWLGYADRDPPQKTPMRRAFERAIAWGRELLRPAGCYAIFAIKEVSKDRVMLDNGTVFHSERLAAECRGARQLAGFIVTIGPDLEGKVQGLLMREPAVALILDGYGTEAVIAATDALLAALDKLIQLQGLRRGMKCCPGCIDWPVREQRELFQLLPGVQLGVRLTAGGMLWPRKSHSCVVPLLPLAAAGRGEVELK